MTRLLDWYDRQHIAVKILVLVPMMIVALVYVVLIYRPKPGPEAVVDHIDEQLNERHDEVVEADKELLKRAVEERDLRHEIDRKIAKLKEKRHVDSNATIDERVDEWNDYWDDTKS
jgi:hypothetical protein